VPIRYRPPGRPFCCCRAPARSCVESLRRILAYVGFAKLKSQIAAKGGARNPGAVAAAIGRRKYGKTAMAKAAASGKSLKGHRTVRGRR